MLQGGCDKQRARAEHRWPCSSYTCVLIASLPLCGVCAIFSEQDDIFKISAKVSIYAEKQLYELEGNGVELGPCSAAAIHGADKCLWH